MSLCTFLATGCELPEKERPEYGTFLFALNCIEAGFAFLLLCSLSIENQSSHCLVLCFQALPQDIAERHVIIY